MKVRLQEITEDAEKTIIYIARVSNPDNQDNPEISKLIKHCITHKHWSVFEHAHITLEIETSLAIATQLLRHGTFKFQQFSQRYANIKRLGHEPVELRKKSKKNRQSSEEPIEENLNKVFQERIQKLIADSEKLYDDMIEADIAPECARFVALQCTKTRLYMTGNIRSWIHWIELRSEEATQKEHRIIAQATQKIFAAHLPITTEALGWEI